MDKIETISVAIQEDGHIIIDNWSEWYAALFATRLSFFRLRDKNTGGERLAVEIFENDEAKPYTKTYCSNANLEQDIYKPCEYGVFLSRKEVAQIVKHIKEYYRNMVVMDDIEARTLECDLPDILRFMCSYIIQQGIKAVKIGDDELYNMPIKDFRSSLKDSKFSRYRQSDIRRILRDMGYSVCSSGRLENTIKAGNSGDTVKVISLHADEPEVVEVMRKLMIESIAERTYA